MAQTARGRHTPLSAPGGQGVRRLAQGHLHTPLGGAGDPTQPSHSHLLSSCHPCRRYVRLVGMWSTHCAGFSPVCQLEEQCGLSSQRGDKCLARRTALLWILRDQQDAECAVYTYALITKLNVYIFTFIYCSVI